MPKPQILLLGAGGHARACIDVIEQSGDYSIAGLIGAPEEVGKNILGYAVIGTDKELGELRKTCDSALVVVGQIQAPTTRIDLFNKLNDSGYTSPIIISPNAYVSQHAQLASGTIVMHGAVINPGASIGKNCIINSQSLIEHDSVIGNHCHISTGVIVNGDVKIGQGSFLGSGCVLREGINIGENCLVGMGLAVRHSLPDNYSVLKRNQ